MRYPIQGILSITILSIILVGLFSCNATKKASEQVDHAYEIHGLLEFTNGLKANPDIQLVDVRTPYEYNQGHIADAINMDFRNDDFTTMIENLDKNKPVYIYCRSGNRSGQSSYLFLDQGFKQIVDLKGGFLAYKKSILDN